MKRMREVCKAWLAGFELAVSGINVPSKAFVLPEGGHLPQHFPGLVILDFGESVTGEDWLQNLRAFTKLRVLILGRPGGWGSWGFASRLTDAGLAHLVGLPITSLDLANCREVTNEGLKCLQSLPLIKLNLQVYCISGPVTHSFEKDCQSTLWYSILSMNRVVWMNTRARGVKHHLPVHGYNTKVIIHAFLGHSQQVFFDLNSCCA